MKDSLEATKKDQRTAYQKALSAKGAVDDRLTRVESLTKEREFIADQLKAREQDLFFHQELVRYHMRENVELKVAIEAKKKEMDDLRKSLRETEGKLESARVDVSSLRQQLRQTRRELEASCSRVRKLEGERAELQAEVNRERREVDRRLMEAAATIPTQEPAQEIEVCIAHTVHTVLFTC